MLRKIPQAAKEVLLQETTCEDLLDIERPDGKNDKGVNGSPDDKGDKGGGSGSPGGATVVGGVFAVGGIVGLRGEPISLDPTIEPELDPPIESWRKKFSNTGASIDDTDDALSFDELKTAVVQVGIERRSDAELNDLLARLKKATGESKLSIETLTGMLCDGLLRSKDLNLTAGLHAQPL